VQARLASRGLDRLCTHQAEAIDRLHGGEDIVVATGTASGKSLCYQLPIVDNAVREAPDTALMLFPTKALAQDQLRSLRSWLVPGLRAVTYDGDTLPDDRTWARKHATVVLTNPEMLHQGILPFHARWATFLMRLRLVVVDELHALRGIFGSHVAQVLRRLRRVCAHYGADPVFCFASATIGNPGELAQALCGRPVVAIDDDGSPHAERCFALWQRPLLDPHLGTRSSANGETAALLARFVAAGTPTLAFTRSRRGAELVAGRARRILDDAVTAGAGGGLTERIAAYRAGYLPEERRDLEARLSDGRLLGVAATNALELGIDVGGLDAVVLNGFPGTLASLRQQAGRAGRGDRRAAAVLVAGDDQLDQWYATHPDDLFTREPGAAVVNPDNPFVLRPHVGCAAHELPLTPDDTDWFGAGLDEAVRDLTGAGEAHLGSVEVSSRVLGYQRKRASTFETIEVVPLDLPAQVLHTRACWYTIPPQVLPEHGVGGCACSAPCTRPSTRSSDCSRCSRSATGGTSGGSRWHCTPQPARRRSSSTTPIPAAPASPSSRTRTSRATCGPPSSQSPDVPATTAVCSPTLRWRQSALSGRTAIGWPRTIRVSSTAARPFTDLWCAFCSKSLIVHSIQSERYDRRSSVSNVKNGSIGSCHLFGTFCANSIILTLSGGTISRPPDMIYGS